LINLKPTEQIVKHFSQAQELHKLNDHFENIEKHEEQTETKIASPIKIS
jgi:hypothetical protein